MACAVIGMALNISTKCHLRSKALAEPSTPSGRVLEKLLGAKAESCCCC